MKKLLVLMLVFTITSFANAGLIDVVIRGYNDNDGSGDISPSDLVYIAITITPPHTSDVFDLGLYVTGPGTLQEVDGGPNLPFYFYSGIKDNAIARMANYIIGGVFTNDLVWGLAIHCDGPGPVTVDLTLNGQTKVDDQPITEADLGDLTIYQVPEPMTAALLALGGLLLLGRRNKPRAKAKN